MSIIIEKLDRKYGTWMFYTALVLFLVSYSWYWCSKTPSLILAITKYSTIFAQIICCIRLGLLSWKYPKYVLLCTLIIALLYLSSHLSHSTMLLNTAMFIAASRDEDINRIVSVFLVVYLIVLIVVPATYVLGWTGDIVKHKCGLVGHSWGFINPNRFAFIVQMLIFMVFLYFRIRKTWIVWLISYSSAAVIGLITLSMTSVVILLLFPLIYYFLKKHTFPVVLYALIPLFLTVFSVGLSIYFGPSTGITTFESRFSIPYMMLDNHGLSFLGQDCGFIPSWEAIRKGIDALYMNNTYLDLPVRHGLITALVTLAFYCHYLYRMGRLNNPQILAMTICLAISGLMQLFHFYIALNFLLLYYFHQPDHIKPIEDAK